MYSIVLFLFYIYIKKKKQNKKCISFLCCFQIISYSDSIWFSSLPTKVCYLYLSNNTSLRSKRFRAVYEQRTRNESQRSREKWRK